MISQADTRQADWLRLDGQVCVVTGAAGGIGTSIVEALVAAGSRVALLDRDADRTIAVAERLRTAGGDVVAIGCDIGDAASVSQAAERVERDFGPVDVLVNNAGLLRAGGIETISLDAWNAMLQVNLTGYMLCSQAFGRAMLARGSGSMVHVASIAARYPQTHSGAYSASKAAVAMLARQLAAEWGPRGIRSNTVCPGMIRTPLSESFYQSGDIEARRSAMTASRRIGRPDDIANVVAFLASPRAAYVNGAELVVDGGLDAMLMDLVPRPGYEAGAGAR
ncbi:SDR family NAD(P)-dependent oxidoreductase [Burkholderia sp. LA-2-3-30-S1-D2]|uniref:SDR family NAD(P)-dependent oxidoreductase n=1 Tax=Burkholderia sp. LA-2-3-30-S1-D2 TaxID=1637862 RepID=UPI0007585DE4|nr:SDR family oxidoreductase [Burkholderia sp. LA-2-3-30-S1-D2]AOJ00167.1 2-deoxy-D-gluconate 3-dehydrogenase [Burkholderia sp. LA-2-3-30-S1-D2]KVE16885.1 2-deoxy-D-gluconate 3-dehydrogenase [Burkholderia sp. LA-2-3-30-S1-D2]